jgi:hypothetical protein
LDAIDYRNSGDSVGRTLVHHGCSRSRRGLQVLLVLDGLKGVFGFNGPFFTDLGLTSNILMVLVVLKENLVLKNKSGKIRQIEWIEFEKFTCLRI